MEVHHHAHTARKKWTHYFWEFLMLFLAVFCGFLAEYQLEHKIERDREKQYSLTLYEDLKADTSILNALISESDFVIPKVDSFRLLVHTKAIGDIPSGTWYYYGRFGTRNLILSLQNVTLQQLISSGGLRYFKKQNVVYNIAAYDKVIRDIKNTLDLQLWTYNEVIKARNQIFDSWFMDEIMDFSITSSKVDSFKQKSFPLLSNKREDFLNYANYCQMRSFNKKGERESLVQALKSAEKLMALLKKEYHLK
ncbi:MAG: hypothetical protein LH619_10965 [Chitinophagaceae bacterium]|nr:hypothetical protein [Chitinophagaceae bacterium]